MADKYTDTLLENNSQYASGRMVHQAEHPGQQPIQPSKRIMIVGQPGSGKSTLARKLGDLLGLPVVHIDTIHWEAGWIERSDSEKDRMCSDVHARDSWIFEGGRSTTWPERLQRADILIWLDIPLPVRAWRVFWRTIRYHGKTRPDLPDGCPEQFNLDFAKWIWNTRNTGRARMLNLFETAPSDKQKYKLTNKRQVERLIAGFHERVQNDDTLTS